MSLSYKYFYDFFMRNTLEIKEKAMEKNAKTAYLHVKRSTAMHKQSNK